MSEPVNTSISSEQQERLKRLFDRLLPLVEGVSRKLRSVLLLGIVLVCWIGLWLFVIKHYSITVTLISVALSLLPLLVLMQFWWAFEELRDLPTIAGEMLGDAKSGLTDSVQDLKAGKINKFSLFTATKGLWSIGGMLREAKDLLGSYLTLTTLINPFMLILGVISFVSIGVLILVSIVMVFLAF